MRDFRGVALGAALVFGAVGLAFALPQAIVLPPPDVPFEVASIKPNKSGSTNSSSNTPPGGGFRAANVTARQLILNAYRLRNFQLTGGPAWIDSDRFDVVARSPENAATDQVGARLRSLLADRFKLTVHIETKEQPIYALVTARADGRLGQQIKPSTLDCSRPSPGSTQRGAAGQTTPPASPAPEQFTCGTNTSVSNSQASGTMRGGGRSLADIAATLGNFVVARMVIDRTGLSGTFDFELKWVPDNMRAGGPDPAGASTPEGPSIFTAVQEQLGLKFEARRAPVEFLVIDSISQPTAD